MKREENCLFCRIIEGKIPSEKVFENENVLGFKDISPMAKIHYLFIHKSHTQDFVDMIDSDPQQVFDILNAISIFQKENKDLQSFRLVTNKGELAGQSVFHTHFHLLAGEKLRGFGS